MRCTVCGYESQDPFEFCQRCGAPAPADELIRANPAADKILPALRDGLFFAICILMSCTCVFSFFSGSIPVINILIMIFLWLAYAQAYKGIADVSHLRYISGTVYAQYVISYVASIIIIVCGVILAVVLAIISFIPELMQEFVLEFDSYTYSGISGVGIVLILAAMVGVFIVAGVVALVINILGTRKIHRFIKSGYQSINSGTLNLPNPRAVRNWLIVFASFSGVSVLPTLVTGFAVAISSGCMTAVYIISAVLINKYFMET